MKFGQCLTRPRAKIFSFDAERSANSIEALEVRAKLVAILVEFLSFVLFMHFAY